MSRIKTLRVKLENSLLDRLEEVAQADDESLNSWVVDALRYRVSLWEVDQVRDTIALEEIEREILVKGQSAATPIEGMQEQGNCEMCLKEIVLDPQHVEGPHFCSKCLEISKGGDFSELFT